MAERPVGVPDTAAGAGVAEIRTRERSVGGNTVAEQFIIPIAERVPSFRGMAATFRRAGDATALQWLWQMQNAAGSPVLVSVRSVVVMMDVTALNVTLNPIFSLTRPTGTRAGGTVLAQPSVGIGTDAAQTSHANVTTVGANASDGGAATAITGLTAGSFMARRAGNRLHSAVGQMLTPPLELIPRALQPEGIILRAGEQLAVHVTTNAAADNLATNWYMVNVLWDEYTLP